MTNRFNDAIKDFFENKYDIEKLIELCDVNTSNFEDFCDCLIIYINQIRIELSPDEIEEEYQNQLMIANDLYRILYNRLKYELKSDELPDDINDKLIRKYRDFNSISNITRTTSKMK